MIVRQNSRSELALVHHFAQCVIHHSQSSCTEMFWLAAVSFFFEHPCKVWVGYPVEVWSTATKPDICYIPITKIESRVVYTKKSVDFGRIHGNQTVFVVVPIMSN